jgi:NADH-quinone oxidoreductase subunit N
VPVGDLLPQIVLLAGAAGVVVTALFTAQPHHRRLAPAAVVALAASAAAQIAGRPAADGTTFDGQWALDDLTVWGGVVIAGTAALAVVLSPRWMATDRRHGEYYGVLLLATLGAR